MIPIPWELRTWFNPDLAAPAMLPHTSVVPELTPLGGRLSPASLQASYQQPSPLLPENLFLQLNFASHLLSTNKELYHLKSQLWAKGTLRWTMHLYQTRCTFRRSHKTIIFKLVLFITHRCLLCYQQFTYGIPKTLENQNKKKHKGIGLVSLMTEKIVCGVKYIFLQ